MEIIDVDAPKIIDEWDQMRIEICKTVWKIYGKKLKIFAGTADFLLYIAEELEEDTSKASLPLSGRAKEQYVDHFGPFTIILIFYMCAMVYSQLFQALTERNLPKAAAGCQFNGRTLTYKAQF